MANELDNNVVPLTDVPTDPQKEHTGSASLEMLSWINRSIKAYKQQPPKGLVNAIMQETGLSYEEAEKQVTFEDITSYILKELDVAYSEYLEQPDIPNARLLREILERQE